MNDELACRMAVYLQYYVNAQLGSMQRTKEIMQYPPTMTKQQIDQLLGFLAVFEAPGFTPFLPKGEYNMTLPYVDAVMYFREVYVPICTEVHPYELLPEDSPGTEAGLGLYGSFASCTAMESASANQIRRLLRGCTRGERFGFASTGDLLAAGVIQAALRRLHALRDSAPD
jgi:hypothetical protein